MKVKLSQVIEAIEMANESCTYYFDSKTGDNVYLTDPLYYGETDKELAALIENSRGRFFPYPTKREIHEYRIMEEFVEALSDGPAKQELYPGIHKKGAFRNFKNGIRYHRLEKRWYDYRADAFRKIAIRWCRDNKLEIEGVQLAMKNIVVVSASPRKNGNSNALVSEFERGAMDGGNQVEVISLIGKKVEFCRGCMVCNESNKCVIQDDVAEINNKLLNADIVVVATPVYYYSVSGQLKTLFDRTTPLFTADYKFREIYLFATAAEDGEEVVEGTVKATQGWVDCFEHAKLVKTIFAGGVNDVGDISGHPALQVAYETGKSIY